jgi:hypothetical protein
MSECIWKFFGFANWQIKIISDCSSAFAIVDDEIQVELNVCVLRILIVLKI